MFTALMQLTTRKKIAYDKNIPTASVTLKKTSQSPVKKSDKESPKKFEFDKVENDLKPIELLKETTQSA